MNVFCRGKVLSERFYPGQPRLAELSGRAWHPRRVSCTAQALARSYMKTYDAGPKRENGPMKEPKQLEIARAHLARAEAHFGAPAALDEVDKALAVLEEIRDRNDEISSLGERIAFTYASKLCDHLKRLLHTDDHVPEPQLEHFFKMLRAFDDSIIELPAAARQLKIELAKRLIDHYLEGHSVEEKAKALGQLLDIAASN